MHGRNEKEKHARAKARSVSRDHHFAHVVGRKPVSGDDSPEHSKLAIFVALVGLSQVSQFMYRNQDHSGLSNPQSKGLPLARPSPLEFSYPFVLPSGKNIALVGGVWGKTR